MYLYSTIYRTRRPLNLKFCKSLSQAEEEEMQIYRREPGQNTEFQLRGRSAAVKYGLRRRRYGYDLPRDSKLM